MAVYGAAAARLVRRPHIITMHGGGYFAGAWRRRIALRWAAKRSHATITVSATLRTDLAAALRLTPTSFRVIRNGVPVCSGSPEAFRRELAIGPHESLVLAIGNLYPVKGHMVLLQAMKLLDGHSGLPPWHLAIAGRGDEERTLRSFAAAHGLADRLHLLGYRDDIVDLLAAADVFALPSLSEGIPLALLEAMFAGKAIVASAVGGVPEVVTEGREAILIPPSDPETLAAGLAQLLQDHEYRRSLGAAARQHARQEFSLAAMVDRYETVYESALS
jgi:glycosyltransferase involved in cell wall biosynthesis